MTDELGFWTTTPYAEGSATLVTMMVPSPPWAKWKSLETIGGARMSEWERGRFEGMEVYVPELLERVRARHIRVEHKEGGIVLLEDLSGKSQRSS